ncbi:MAG: IS66 family transposase zinc-finger binding domain-containing protein [Acidobacteria bacterium]|nr:IS66 family transposase zinc-finger binding domain-containing protein [Acidobacteriota bacterium]
MPCAYPPRPLAPHFKRERIEHDLSAAEKHCVDCQQDLHCIGEETSEHCEYIPAKFVVIEDVCKKSACECTVKTATSITRNVRTAGMYTSASSSSRVRTDCPQLQHQSLGIGPCDIYGSGQS